MGVPSGWKWHGEISKQGGNRSSADSVNAAQIPNTHTAKIAPSTASPLIVQPVT